MRRIARLGVMLAIAGASAPAHAEGDPFLRRTTTVRVVERSGPAVVNVTTEQRAPEAGNPFRPFAGDPFFDRFFQDFFEPRVPGAEQSLGSGVLIDSQRHVLTNEHVVSTREITLNEPNRRVVFHVSVSKIEVCFPPESAAVRGGTTPCWVGGVLYRPRLSDRTSGENQWRRRRRRSGSRRPNRRPAWNSPFSRRRPPRSSS